MKLSKSLLQMAAIVVIALLGAAGAGCSPSSTAMASDPTPTAAPAEPTTMPAEPTTVPPLRLPTLPDKLPQQASPADRTTATAEVGSSAQGSVYTWQDGDRTMRVVLQTDLVVQKTETNEPGDVLVVRVGAHSIVRKKAGRGTDAGPVFRLESGGGLMTLPGGILLALDPEWDRDTVAGFFSRYRLRC